MLSLAGRILISDLVVANLFIHSLPGMIQLLALAAPFYTEGVFAWDIITILLWGSCIAAIGSELFTHI